MKKILFLIDTLGGGGAEKVLVNLVNNMDRSRFDITVETMFSGGSNVDNLSNDIKYICKHAPHPKGLAYFFRFFPSKLLYLYFVGKENYDIVVAYMHGASVKVVSGGPKNIKKFAWLHNSNPDTGTFFKFWFTKKAAFNSYKECQNIVAVSESVKKIFCNFTGIQDVSVVYNTNDVKHIHELSLYDSEYVINSPISENAIRIVSVGRVSKVKGFDRLYNCCKKLRNEGYNIIVNIVGTGKEEKKLKEDIANSHDCDWFNFCGFQSNPYPIIKNSDMFVCSSYYEGLSTAVTEAIILGKPCISTDVSGAKEILGENNEYGIVVENSEDGIYAGIKQMLTDDNLKYYAEKAKERASFFATEKTVKEAEDLFLGISK